MMGGCKNTLISNVFYILICDSWTVHSALSSLGGNTSLSLQNSLYFPMAYPRQGRPKPVPGSIGNKTGELPGQGASPV